MTKNYIAIGLTSILFSCAAIAEKPSRSFGNNTLNTNITRAEVQKAQENWGKALIQISSAHSKGGFERAQKVAEKIIDQAYGYNFGPVLFKPTLASGSLEQTFRTTKEGALSYFVGGNSNFSQDGGFALKNWVKYDYKNAAVYISGDTAITMGHVILTNSDGKTTMVDKTWGFKKGDDGSVRIVLHHSSLPYSP